ncbi:two-component regulator propeller domain-containing protein [Halocola ammonii]
MHNSARQFLFLLLFLIAQNTFAQKLNYEHFDNESGLTNSFVNTINKGAKGYLFIGTGEGLFRYDGFEFVKFDKNSGLSENIIECSFQDSKGRLWFGHKNGGITIYNGHSFRVLPMGPYADSKIVDFTEDESGNIWAASQSDGILRFDSELSIRQFVNGFEDYVLHTLEILESDLCIAGSDMGALKFTLPSENNEVIDVQMIMEVPLTNIYSMVKREDQLILAADDEGVFSVSSSSENEGLVVDEILPELDLDRFQFYSVSCSPSGDLWLATRGKSLWKIEFENENKSEPSLINYNEENSLGALNIKTVFTDEEKNAWVGSFGQGLYKLKPSPVVFYSYGKGAEDDDIHSVYFQDNEYWLGGHGRLLNTRTNPGHVTREYNAENSGLPRDKITSLVKDSAGNLWLGTRNSGLFRKLNSDTVFEKIQLERGSLAEIINDLEIFNDKLCVATGSGLFILEGEKIIDHLTVASGLPHNSVKALATYKGELWVAAKGSLLSRWTGKELISMNVPVDDRLMQTSSLETTHDESLLVSTLGNGVLTLDSLGKWSHFLREDGLYSDFCYSLTKSSDGKIWVGHNGGLSFMLPGKGWQIFEETEDMDCATYSNAMYSDRENNVAIGTDKGLLYYTASKDAKNTVEPELIISEVVISDSVYNYTEGIDLRYGTYRLRVDYLGLSYQNPEEVEYSYFLEGHDPGWSEPTKSRTAIYNRLDPGTYTFKLKAFNSDGVGGESVESFTIFVDKPFWLKWWFFVLVIVFLIALVRFIIVRRLRFLEANQEYLKKELNARSKEVLSQKELLEQKNKDITDSIIYAKHIQTAMMPSDNEMHQCFPESFVFNKPRDIVSGDFYWVKEFEEKIVLVCADCTGHGVPGAFMSLISTSLLKEVSNSREIDSPAKAMLALQQEMRRTLSQDHQNTLRDGMDVSLVELDKNTLEVRMASARRPVVFYQNGERKVLSGDRLSIGDATPSDDFEFTEHTIQMNKGDLIYMFSDGLQDQFGGEKGKKLKKKGLLNLLDDLTAMNMREQQEHIARRFAEWKGSYEQVDDIILIGVRL